MAEVPVRSDTMSPSGGRPSTLSWLVVGACMVWMAVMQAGPWVAGDGTVQWHLFDWWIEDAAISFAYARNVADGYGLVPTPGGELVEGYSNPLWVALLVPFELVGISAWYAAKALGLALGMAMVWLAWRLADRALGGEAEAAALVAPVLVAATPTNALWATSGLENPLLVVLILAAIWQAGREADRDGASWSALLWLGVSLTRPEGVIYAAVGGFASMVARWRAGHGVGPTLRWLALFFVPFVAYHGVRFWYFAWPFPNTYYAKLGDLDVDTTNWTSRGWRHVRAWAQAVGAGWWLAPAALGLTGLRGWRGLAGGLGAVVLVWAWMHPDAPIARAAGWPPLPVPPDWASRRVLLIAASTVLLPLALAGRGGLERGALWGCSAVAVLFCIRANGDWMAGYRWMAMVAPPLAILAAIGLGEVGQLVARWVPLPQAGRAADVVLAVAACAWLAPQGWEHLQQVSRKPETPPSMVKKRSDYTRFLLDRMWVRDEAVANLEVDMGAHLTWTRDHMVDYAGLVDVPIAHHSWRQGGFVRQYLFEETRPDVAHIHKHWARTTRIPNYSQFTKGWVEVPGYEETATSRHGGMYVRRDRMVVRGWDGPVGRRTAFADGTVVQDMSAPAASVVQDGRLFVDLAVSHRSLTSGGSVRLLGFLSDGLGHTATFDLPLGYDWIPPQEWLPGEVFTGRFAVPVDGLPPGTYRLGALLVQDGRGVVPVEQPPVDGRVAQQREDAWVAVGEVRYDAEIQVLSADAAIARSGADRQLAIEEADREACVDAERSWRRAWTRMPDDEGFVAISRPLVAPHLAACWARQAESVAPRDAVPLLERSRVWEPGGRAGRRAASVVGGALAAQGAAAWSASDWKAAFEAYRDAVRADPRRSWSRRWAEQARDRMLGL